MNMSLFYKAQAYTVSLIAKCFLETEGRKQLENGFLWYVVNCCFNRDGIPGQELNINSIININTSLANYLNDPWLLKIRDIPKIGINTFFLIYFF